MAARNGSDCRCASGRGNVAADNLGPLDDLIAAEAAERGDPPRLPKNKRAVREDPRWIIRIGLPAEEK